MNELLHNKYSLTPPVILDTSAVESLNNDVDEIPETDLEEEEAEESLPGKVHNKMIWRTQLIGYISTKHKCPYCN